MSAIYLIKSNNKLKIGYSKNPWKRYKQLCTGSADNLALVMTFYCKNTRDLEKYLHKRFDKYRVNGEWFSVSVMDVLTELSCINLTNYGHFSDPQEIETPKALVESEFATDEEMDDFFDEINEMLADNKKFDAKNGKCPSFSA